MKRALGPWLLLAAFVGGLVVACATPEQESVRPLKSSSSKDRSKDKDDDDETAPVPTTVTTAVPTPVEPIDAGGGGSATTYVGTLSATPTVRFGGDPYCYYDVTLEDVKIEVAALPSGEIIGAQVQDTMVEGSVPPCVHSPAPPSLQTFAFTTATATAEGYQLAFNGAATNHPATKLVLDLKKVGSSYEAAASWKRTDQTAPLDWKVTSTFTLGPR